MNKLDLHQVQESWSPWSLLSDSGRGLLRRAWARLGFNRDTASVLRYELDMVMLRSYCALSPAHHRHLKSLRQRRDLRIHLGCGNALLEGFVNVDCYPPPRIPGIEILQVDMRRGLPFADDSAEVLFSEHFLEHVPMETVRDHLLPDIHRILKPGGLVRISVPNGEFFIRQYLAAREGRADSLYSDNSGTSTPMAMLVDVTRAGGHQYLYDFETLAGLFRQAGFVDIRQASPFDSQAECLRDKDRNDPWRIAMSLYVEARKAD